MVANRSIAEMAMSLRITSIYRVPRHRLPTVHLFDEFVDPHSGMPMVRIYQDRVPVPVRGSVGQVVTVTVERKTFRGVIRRIDKVEAVIAL